MQDGLADAYAADESQIVYLECRSLLTLDGMGVAKDALYTTDRGEPGHGGVIRRIFEKEVLGGHGIEHECLVVSEPVGVVTGFGVLRGEVGGDVEQPI